DHELAAQVARARCRVVVADVPRELGPPRVSVESLLDAKPDGVDAPAEPQRPLALLFTSGTTGAPKAAVLSLGALMAHARASALHLGGDADDLHLCTLPLFHIGGLAMVFRAAECGGGVALHERFDPQRVLHALATRPVTHLSLVAATLARLLDALGPAPLRAPALRAILLGGG